jgi:hypothetical protein
VNRVQLLSDALAAYVEAAEKAFGADDYGQIVKASEPIGPGRYSPPDVTRVWNSAPKIGRSEQRLRNNDHARGGLERYMGTAERKATPWGK